MMSNSQFSGELSDNEQENKSISDSVKIDSLANFSSNNPMCENGINNELNKENGNHNFEKFISEVESNDLSIPHLDISAGGNGVKNDAVHPDNCNSCDQNNLTNTVNLKSNHGNSSSEDNGRNSVLRITKLVNSNALSALLAYGESSSSDEENNEAENDNISEAVAPTQSNVVTVNVCKNINIGNCQDGGPSRTCDTSSCNNSSAAFTESQHETSGGDDDDLLSVSSSSSSSSISTSLVFSENSGFSDDSTDDEDDKNNVAKSCDKAKKKLINSNKKNLLLTEGEFTFDELPPIEDLHISVPQNECVLLGNILNIVDRLVVVQAIKDLPPLDLDSVLFLEYDKPLGHVFDVIGPVKEPLYCVRFNSSEHIKQKDVSPGLPVYFVPKSNHTNYVFLSHLMSMKGSDASWTDNNEPPLEFLDYSDDEEERNAKKFQQVASGRSSETIKRVTERDPEEPLKKRPTAFERRMNQRNLRITELQKRQALNKKPFRQQSHLIRPPTFMPPTPSCDFNVNSAVPPFSSEQPHFDFRVLPPPLNTLPGNKPPESFPSFNPVNQDVSFLSSRVPHCENVTHQSFSNRRNMIIPKDSPPMPWTPNPFASSSSTFNLGSTSVLPPPFHASNVFLPSPSHVVSSHSPINHLIPPGPLAFQSPPPFPVGSVFSSPTPNNSNNVNFSPTFQINSRAPHSPNIFSPFATFSSRSDT